MTPVFLTYTLWMLTTEKTASGGTSSERQSNAIRAVRYLHPLSTPVKPRTLVLQCTILLLGALWDACIIEMDRCTFSSWLSALTG